MFAKQKGEVLAESLRLSVNNTTSAAAQKDTNPKNIFMARKFFQIVKFAATCNCGPVDACSLNSASDLREKSIDSWHQNCRFLPTRCKWRVVQCYCQEYILGSRRLLDKGGVCIAQAR